mmetsp:Transcript_2693/g.2674  ORF Transcript_2693/g.2674 Transcript_2693/m.2674 type:complete len:411 (+) Transcript_2693:82-1314(+)
MESYYSNHTSTNTNILNNFIKDTTLTTTTTAIYPLKNYNNDVTTLPSATATPINNEEEYSAPMFIEASNITFCDEFDTFLDLGVDIGLETVAQADAIISEVTANEIPSCNSIIALPECYDAIVVKEKYDDLKSDMLYSDDLLFAEIIDDLAGFNEEEKSDNNSQFSSSSSLSSSPSSSSSLLLPSSFQFDPFMISSEFLNDEMTDSQFGLNFHELNINNTHNQNNITNNKYIYNDLSLQQNQQKENNNNNNMNMNNLSQLPLPQLQKSKSQTQYFIEPQLFDVNHQMQFSIGAPKPLSMLPPPPSRNRSISTSKLNSSSHTVNSNTNNMKNSLNQVNKNITPESTLPPLTPKAIRDRQQALLKWKDKREEKIEETRSLDARQLATAKRERSNGKFAKRKINWVSITDISK